MKRWFSRASLLIAAPALAGLLLVKIIYPFCIIRSAGWSGGQTSCCSGQLRKWHNATIPVPIEINREGSGEESGEATANAIRRAMQSWNAVESSVFEFVDDGLTDSRALSNDQRNLVFFDNTSRHFPEGSTSLAFSRTLTINDALGYRAIDADMVFNGAQRWRVGPQARNEFDIETVALHEFGHHLGLDHAGGGRDTEASSGCGPVVPQAVMFWTAAPQRLKRTLHSDDIAGLTQIYPRWVLDGVVRNTLGEPLPNILLEFEGTSVPRDTIAVTELRTNSFGEYHAPVVQNTFRVIAAEFGFRSEVADVSFADAGTQFHSFILTPLPLSSIEGRATNRATGKGVAAKITIFANGTILRETETDANGHFVFERLPVTDPLSNHYDRIRVEPVAPFPVTEVADDIIVVENQPTLFNFELDSAEVLLVDDDGAEDIEQFYTDALESLDMSYVLLDLADSGPVGQSLDRFPRKTVLWFSGSKESAILEEAEIEALRTHLKGNGKLFLTGQNIAEDLSIRENAFLSENLHVRWSSAESSLLALGIEDDPVGHGITLLAIDGGDGARNQRSPDSLIPDEGAEVAIVYQGSESAAAVRIAEGIAGVAGSRIVFFGFGFEGINELPHGVTTRPAVMAAVLEWLTDSMTTSVTGRGSEPADRFVLHPNFPNPFNAGTEINYSVPTQSNATALSLRIYNLAGQHVRTLFTEPTHPAGQYSARWDGRDDSGNTLATGVYVYRLAAPDFFVARKLLLLK